jgi:hypothetical protein
MEKFQEKIMSMSYIPSLEPYGVELKLAYCTPSVQHYYSDSASVRILNSERYSGQILAVLATSCENLSN